LSIVVIGAGLAGLTVAQELAAAGQQVTVVERREAPGLETSARNGSLQHPSHAEPWNAPGIWRTLLANLGREDGAMLLRLSAVPSLVGWGLQFLSRSNTAHHRAASVANLRLAQPAPHGPLARAGVGLSPPCGRHTHAAA
jgi:D-amino-acid dehydrogenase